MCFEMFELASGLKVNFFKSNLFGVACNDESLGRFASSLHCKTSSLPFKYLGLPVGGNPRRISFWEPVLRRVRNRLALWKNKTLSFGGRICLIKSVLSSIPLFFLSFFKAPLGVVKSCHRLMKKNLWGGSEDRAKIVWVSWEKICMAKEEGGLGIRDVGKFNLALLGKWRWRLLRERDNLWCKVIRTKYLTYNSSKASIWWQDLKQACFS